MRLDKFLANNTPLSRREVKFALKDGDVSIDGQPVRDGAQKISSTLGISLRGETVAELGDGYFMLFKPDGVVCANTDPIHPTVFDLIDEPHTDMHVAGRLDLDTTGLVILTGDGQWSHTLTSPKRECVKRYKVEAAEALTPNMIQRLERGVVIGREKKRTKPAIVQQLSDYDIVLQITEGRYHQVKQMLAAVGNAVTQLHRESIGAIELDPTLAMGEYRPLTQAEISGTAAPTA